ncbi:Imm31 family immunity protein [Shewanella sp. JNE10-2]|uniref:Imm31 family immunity protein n=1 Tax=unclassified Shewanella TaxID=196818 RepID=UPI00005FBCD4|nr:MULTISPECIES: Imm31 family immunity protein [unclassified Shewanella]ABM25544.1 hypothetical protein Sputw3181_2727 [Shewanella sp. W3-18-1]MCK7631929.1 Imm31 family immunity protein [Shewanella sp. JNE9-1]MCK7647115.1 Imm31 family immunity protein [Shewanella sp. JNE3-1]MCK7655232.1 Imm31 family immunity protein [Shewanella sp. JNE4-1]UPO25852.1 Imm31 family immunity protein [Shewanella sp. JNE10-2]
MKYQFYEVVKVVRSYSSIREIDGKVGVVVGFSNDDIGNEIFSVLIAETEEVWSIPEDEIEATGQVLTKLQYENRDYIGLLEK